MAEYYPLLARAIAGLPQSTPETRRAIYDRAKTALIGQLRAVQPPIAEDDIQRESRMLDEAIARLEREAVPAPAPAAPATPPAAASPPPAEPRRPIEPMRRPEGSLVRPTAQSSRPALPPRPTLPPRPGSQVSDRSASLGALDAARQRLASLNRTPPAGTPAATAPPPPAPQPPAPAPPKADEPRRDAKPVEPAPQPPVPVAQPSPPPPAPSGPSAPQLEAKAPAQAVAPPARAPGPPLNPPAPEPRVEAASRDADSAVAPSIEPPKPVPTEAAIAASRLAADAGAERRETPAPMNVTLRKYGPRAEAAGVSADLPPASDDPFDEPRTGGVRPAAPLPPQEKERNFRPLLIGVPVALVVGAIAVFAYVRRDNPEELARLRPAPGAETPAEQTTGKIVERIGGGQAARTNDAPAQPQQQTPAQQPAQQAQQAPASNGPVAPATQRAALLVDAPDEAQRVRTYVGNVVWRLDNVSRGPGQPLAIGVRAELDLPDAKLRAVVLIQKNTDDTLPASHTIEIRFTPTDGGPIPGVAQISTPQMRKEDTPAGDALMGVPAPILRNFFLVGLTRGDTASTRNMDLLRTRGWIDIPMLLSDQRIAKITFEKGAAGERVVNEALEAWK